MTSDFFDEGNRLPRIPIEREVQLEFESLAGFVSEYASNLSMGGMFINTRQPQPVGTKLSFQLRLNDDFDLVRGRGEVVWVREADETPTRPAGMGIRFLEIDAASREMIFRVVDHHIQQGGDPFDLSSEA